MTLPWRPTPGPCLPQQQQRAPLQAPTPTHIRRRLRAKRLLPHSSTRPPTPRTSSPSPEAREAQSPCAATMTSGLQHQCPCQDRLVARTASGTAGEHEEAVTAPPRAPMPCRSRRPAAPPTWRYRGGIRASGGRGASSTRFSRRPRSIDSASGADGA